MSQIKVEKKLVITELSEISVNEKRADALNDSSSSESESELELESEFKCPRTNSAFMAETSNDQANIVWSSDQRRAWKGHLDIHSHLALSIQKSQPGSKRRMLKN
ncbi:uncharacterized protein [Rutidosis leptorrhynchoides]|uniref:uncharacterized protein isoform X2 n=1 Tax=Rutidosis leptorrhynchoides TaxID=125765 RepID=UPI003A9A3D86